MNFNLLLPGDVMFFVEELLRCGNPWEWVRGICKNPKQSPKAHPAERNQNQFQCPQFKQKVLHFMLYWVSIYCLISACKKRLQLKQKDVSKYLTPFFLLSSVWNCQLLWGFDYKGGKKGWIGLKCDLWEPSRAGSFPGTPEEREKGKSSSRETQGQKHCSSQS